MGILSIIAAGVLLSVTVVCIGLLLSAWCMHGELAAALDNAEENIIYNDSLSTDEYSRAHNMIENMKHRMNSFKYRSALVAIVGIFAFGTFLWVVI